MWNEALDLKLKAFEKLFADARDTVQFLKAAKERDITPEELTGRIAREQKRQTLCMDRICKAAIALGGKVKTGKPEETGLVHHWTITLDLNTKYVVVFDFGRVYEAEIYDLPLSHQFWISHKSDKGKLVRRFYVRDQGYNDCESVPEFKKYLEIAHEYLAEQTNPQ